MPIFYWYFNYMVAKLLSSEELVKDLNVVADICNLKIWGADIVPQNNKFLFKIYLESLEKNLTVEDCQEFSNKANRALLVNFEDNFDYVLEVSSPGVDRKLFDVQQCAKYIGSKVVFKLKAPIDSKRKLKGIIFNVDIDNNKLFIKEINTNEELIFNYADIVEIRLDPDW